MGHMAAQRNFRFAGQRDYHPVLGTCMSHDNLRVFARQVVVDDMAWERFDVLDKRESS
jgi:hypothetical protein